MIIFLISVLYLVPFVNVLRKYQKTVLRHSLPRFLPVFLPLQLLLFLYCWHWFLRCIFITRTINVFTIYNIKMYWLFINNFKKIFCIELKNIIFVNLIHNMFSAINFKSFFFLVELDKNWWCDCGRQYKQRRSLWRHLKYECGVEGKYNCSHCFKTFKHKFTLVKHKFVYCSKNR